MLRDAKNNRLYRAVTITVIYPPEIFKPTKHTYRAEPHKGFGPEAIDDLLMQTTDKLDGLYPYWDFKLVPLAPQGRRISYVVKFAGYRAMQPVAGRIPVESAQEVKS